MQSFSHLSLLSASTAHDMNDEPFSEQIDQMDQPEQVSGRLLGYIRSKDFNDRKCPSSRLSTDSFFASEMLISSPRSSLARHFAVSRSAFPHRNPSKSPMLIRCAFVPVMDAVIPGTRMSSTFHHICLILH
ncbi:unnamed protein product, partial [Mesorhabditis belari]|uniref:Uncharacterized protein n=1 Tax=Mesorhabditis belari TaxID=2138241 RepID=A0AAF3EKE3_9BILA